MVKKVIEVDEEEDLLEDEPASPFGDEPSPAESFDEVQVVETKDDDKGMKLSMAGTRAQFAKMLERINEDNQRKLRDMTDEHRMKMKQTESKLTEVLEELHELKKRTAIPAENLSSSAATQERVLKHAIKAYGLDDRSEDILNGRRDIGLVADVFNTLGANIRRLSAEKEDLNDKLSEGGEDAWKRTLDVCEDKLVGRKVQCFNDLVDMARERDAKFQKDEEKATFYALALAMLARSYFRGIPNPIIEEVERFSE